MQYLVWAAVPAYLLSFKAATAYNFLGGFLLIEIYNRASGGYPWYHIKLLNNITSTEQVALLGVWITLLVVISAGIRRITQTRPPPTTTPTHSQPLTATPPAASQTHPGCVSCSTRSLSQILPHRASSSGRARSASAPRETQKRSAHKYAYARHAQAGDARQTGLRTGE